MGLRGRIGRTEILDEDVAELDRTITHVAVVVVVPILVLLQADTARFHAQRSLGILKRVENELAIVLDRQDPAN